MSVLRHAAAGGRARKYSAALMYPPDLTQDIVASPDGRRLFYGAQQMQSNIWMVKQPAAAPAAVKQP